ncbi:MAG TPA: hypothetical protein ENK57_20520 [Polyangiaceae bacterium]|nr:hypothetical protein [Polyangiaceae bacterium]
MTRPAFALCAWLAVTCLAAALTWTEARWVACVGAFLTHWISVFVGLDWVTEMNIVSLQCTKVEAYAYLAGESVLWALPLGLSIGLGFILLRGRVAVCWWLPLAWGAGELVRFEVINVNIGDWLVTQWTVTPVLRALGHAGWWPTQIACLFAASCAGQALATRRRGVALPSVIVILALLLLPPLPSEGNALLRGVAAVHTNSTVALPHGAPHATDADDRVELIVWPETAFHLRAKMMEGPGRGTRIPRLVHDSRAAQLIGLETTWPVLGSLNQVVVVRDDGLVLASRAKKLLLPVAERRFLGLGHDRYPPGSYPALLEAAGRAIIPLICGEILSRALVAEGIRAGGELLVVIAGDQMMTNDRARRQLLAVQVLRSVEFGVPSIRASFGGWAYFISSSGQVLARSGHTRNGLLRWDEEHGARDVDFYGRATNSDLAPKTPPRDIVVLYSRDAPQFRTRCPEGRCSYRAIEDFRCSDSERAATVVVAGHGAPPTYLSHTSEELGVAIRCFSPELVVIDTCFGASIELLATLEGLDTLVVAAPFLIPPAGFNYLPEFFASNDAARRARAVVSSEGGRLLRWRFDKQALSSAIARVAAMDATTLRRQLVRRNPAQVGVSLGAAGRVLVPFDWRRMGGATTPSGALPPTRATSR